MGSGRSIDFLTKPVRDQTLPDAIVAAERHHLGDVLMGAQLTPVGADLPRSCLVTNWANIPVLAPLSHLLRSLSN